MFCSFSFAILKPLVAERVVAIPYQRFGTCCRFHLQGPLGNSPEDRPSPLLRGGSLKSRLLQSYSPETLPVYNCRVFKLPFILTQ